MSTRQILAASLLIATSALLAQPARADENAATASSLQLGEYSCAAPDGSALLALGFIAISDTEYGDLDSTAAGTYAIAGTDVTFTSGHLDGQVGHDFDPIKGLTLGEAICEPW